MNELLEMIEDLETINSLTMHPALDETVESLLTKYKTRFEDMERDMERQGEFEFYGS